MKEFDDFLNKHSKELNKMCEGKLFVWYYKKKPYSNPCLAEGSQLEKTKSVYRIIRPLIVYELINKINHVQHEEQENLKLIFELEKKVEELEKLKDSVAQIKKFIE